MDKDLLLKKASICKSAEELLDTAKKENISITIEEAKSIFDESHTQGMISDDELNSVSGGKGVSDEEIALFTDTVVLYANPQDIQYKYSIGETVVARYKAQNGNTVVIRGYVCNMRAHYDKTTQGKYKDVYQISLTYQRNTDYMVPFTGKYFDREHIRKA